MGTMTSGQIYPSYGPIAWLSRQSEVTRWITHRIRARCTWQRSQIAARSARRTATSAFRWCYCRNNGRIRILGHLSRTSRSNADALHISQSDERKRRCRQRDQRSKVGCLVKLQELFLISMSLSTVGIPTRAVSKIRINDDGT